VQDCSVLLIYGERACYFASPYVDAYGERHKQFRGRPLFLDARRLEALRRLWATQRVAYEVVHSRSAAKHVIFNGTPQNGRARVPEALYLTISFKGMALGNDGFYLL
jgi:hypothetical protein